MIFMTNNTNKEMDYQNNMAVSYYNTPTTKKKYNNNMTTKTTTRTTRRPLKVSTSLLPLLIKMMLLICLVSVNQPNSSSSSLVVIAMSIPSHHQNTRRHHSIGSLSSSKQRQRHQQQQTEKRNGKESNKKKIEFVNFWGTACSSSSLTGDGEDDDLLFELPCVTNLDSHHVGPLPKGSYYPLLTDQQPSSTITSSSSSPSSPSWLYPTNNQENDIASSSLSSSSSSMNVCRLVLELNFDDGAEVSSSSTSKSTKNNNNNNYKDDTDDTWISQLHDCIDSGFTSFMFKNDYSSSSSSAGPGNILNKIGRFQKRTPSYIDTHWTIPLSTLPLSITPKSIRRQITSMLQQTHSEIIDTLLVDYQTLFDSSNNVDDDNPTGDYHLDVLDILRELQREGYIRSIAVSGMSRQQRLQQIQNGFGSCVQLQHQSGNLLHPPSSSSSNTNTHYREEEQEEQRIPTWWTNPYSEGVLLLKSLTDRQNPPSLTSKQIQIIEEWVDGRRPRRGGKKNDSGSDNADRYFEETVLEPLQYMALKYQVSPKSVVLRSTMELAFQQNPKTSLIVPFSLSSSANTCDSVYHQDNPNIVTTSEQIRDLRNVFTFSLSEDEEDIEQMKEITKPLSKRNTQQKNRNNREYLIDTIPLDMLEEFGTKEIPMELLREFHSSLNPEENDDDEEEEKEYPEIDFSNQSLWL